MQTILTVIEVVVCIALVAAVLLQQGKGADAGAAFGSGASGTVFGAAGSATFLSKLTAVLATTFFALTLALAILAGRAGPAGTTDSVIDSAPAAQESDLPVAADENLTPVIAPEDIAPAATQEADAPAVDSEESAPAVSQ